MTIAYAQEAAQQASEDVKGEIDVNPSAIFQKIDDWVDGAIRLLPNIVVAVIVLALFVLLAWILNKSFEKWARSRDRENLGAVIGGFIRWLTIGIGILLALTIVIPTLKPGDLIAGLGVSSVAIGFAFKDILQNWLAGMLLLFRQPFQIGDQIVAQGYEGTVERIETRATIIKTYDGRQVLIPNSDVYTNSVLVNTAFDHRRSQYDVGIGYGDDIGEATEAILDAVRSVEGVRDEPAPEVICTALGDFSVALRARWWTRSKQTDVVHIQSDVIVAIKKALDEAGIDMPFETQVHLWHDQSEEVDGVRSKHREGWPSKPGSKDPKPRYADGFGLSRMKADKEPAKEKSA